ncbi:MAG TPA: hypothetical protein DEH22_11280 [Chloroflexi bacterium]|nr:hypothetical protein [Chloroflexota bacterium]
MKNNFRRIFLLFLSAVLLALTLFPSPLQASSAQASAESNSPASFKIETARDDYLDLSVTAPAYQIGKQSIEGRDFDTLFVPGATSDTTPGAAELPIVSTLVGVPPQAQISLEILDESAQNLAGQYQIAPAPYPAPLMDESDTTARWDYDFAQAMPALNQASSTAFSAVRIADEAWMRDQRLIRLEYSPFEYEPASGTLKWYPYLKVRLHFEYPAGQGEVASSQTPAADPTLESYFADTLLNYEQAAQWRALPDTNPLVTPPEVGSRYRIGITEDGIYKLTYEELYAANPAIAGVSSRLLHMTSQGADIAIQVIDANGTFGPGDTIIFYGQRFYGERLADLYQSENTYWANLYQQQTDGSFQLWKPQFNAIMLEKYTLENVYWLYVGTNNGLRMSTVNGDISGNSNDPVPYYRETAHAEQSYEWKTTLFTSEDTWFWKKMNQANTTYNFTTDLTAIAVTAPEMVVRGEFVSDSYNLNVGADHHTQVSLNSHLIDDTYWSGKSRYHFEITTDTIALNEGTNTLSVVAKNDAQVIYPVIFFDWFEIEYNRFFQSTDNALEFSNVTTGLQKYQVSNFSDTNNVAVLDISNPLTPVRVLNPEVSAGQVTISLTNAAPLSVVMDGNPQAVPGAQVSYYTPPTWSAMANGVDYVYITHADFVAATQQLANYRATQSGLSTRVINIQDLYNEFNFGIFNPIAIKNFLAYTFDQWQTPPTYTLLVGDGHWNFFGYRPTYYIPTGQYIPPNLAWVDPWQGEVDSANLLANVVGNDPLADVFIARLPVNSSAEIDAYRAKLTAYEAPHTPEAWEQNHVFVADQADDAGNFPATADDVINQFIGPAPFASEIRIYEDDYGCSAGIACPAVNTAIVNTLNDPGALIINYIGHASVNRWSHEQVFLLTDLPRLQNAGKLPVVLSMDCLDGFWSGPGGYPGTSLIEEIVRQSNTGAIAAFSPTGLGVSSGHDILHKGFYDSLMNEGNWGLGAASMNAKLWLYNVGVHADLLHTYTVFGDPALEIRNPFHFIASPSESNKTTYYPGSTVTHNLTIQNTGTTTDTYEISVSSAWETTLPFTTTQSVAAGANLVMPVGIVTPNQYNVSDTAQVTITSQGNRANTFEAQLTTSIPVVYIFNLSPTNSSVNFFPNASAKHTFTITNQGLLGNQYNLSLSGATWPTSLSTSSTPWLDPGESTTVDVLVDTPNAQAVNDSATLTVTPVDGPQDSQQATLTTRVPNNYDFTLTPSEAAQTIAPGSEVTYTLTIQNAGLSTDQYHIQVSGNNWNTTLSTNTTGSLALNESLDVIVTVETPSQGNLTDSATITVTSDTITSEARQASIITSTSAFMIYLPLTIR